MKMCTKFYYISYIIHSYEECFYIRQVTYVRWSILNNFVLIIFITHMLKIYNDFIFTDLRIFQNKNQFCLPVGRSQVNIIDVGQLVTKKYLNFTIIY